MPLTLTALTAIPDVQPTDHLATLLLQGLTAAGVVLADNDILVIAQKIVSKAEGRLVQLSAVEPSLEAVELAAEVHKDPRLVELILQESSVVSRKRLGLLIVRHRLGFTSANAGIDSSNIGKEMDDTVLLLPLDPDGTAAQLQTEIEQKTGCTVGIVISDSHGRPFRMGTVGVAIGAAGVPTLWDRRGEPDRYGYILQHTDVGTADELAAAAGLLMGQGAEGCPAVHFRGLQFDAPNGVAADLIRPPEKDLYR